MQPKILNKFVRRIKQKQVFRRVVPAIVLIIISCISAITFAADDSDSLPALDRIEFTDVDGKRHSFDSRVDQRALVLVFVTTDCPIANSYQPLLAKLHHDFKGKEIQFLMVHEGPDQSPAKLRLHAKEYGVVFPIVMDADHAIARKLDAKKTPEAVVIGNNGRVVYQGRIDDLHQGFGKKRSVVTREDLRIALNEMDAGKSISVPKTNAVGCSISYAVGSKQP
jgi:peroxiredoxin